MNETSCWENVIMLSYDDGIHVDNNTIWQYAQDQNFDDFNVFASFED